MAIRYAKNPAELVILNPTKTKRKTMARKESAYNKFVGQKLKEGKTMKQAAAEWKRKGSRSNPESHVKRVRAAKKGWKNRSHHSRRNPAFEPGKHIAAGILAFEGMRVVKFLVEKYGTKLSDHIKTGINIGLPAAAALGVGIKGNSSFASGLTTGFIISAANETLDVIPKVNDYLGDEGPVYLGDGALENQVTPQLPSAAAMPPANTPAQYLGASSWETGETWEP